MSNDNNHISWLLIVCQILCYTIVQMVKFHLYKTLRSRCFVIPICLIRKVRRHPVTEGVTASSREGKQASSSHAWPQSACSWLGFLFFFFNLTSYIISSCSRGQTRRARRPSLASGNSSGAPELWSNYCVSGLFYVPSFIPSFYPQNNSMKQAAVTIPIYM